LAWHGHHHHHHSAFSSSLAAAGPILQNKLAWLPVPASLMNHTSTVAAAGGGKSTTTNKMSINIYVKGKLKIKNVSKAGGRQRREGMSVRV
jgi:hypothetical protein